MAQSETFMSEHLIKDADMYFSTGNFDKAILLYKKAIQSIHISENNPIEKICLIATLKNKIQSCKWNRRDKETIHTHLGCVLYHLQRMDVEMVSDLLPDNIMYQDMKKDAFIHKLSLAIDLFKEKGNTYLDRREGFCNAEICNYKKRGFLLKGNHTEHYMALIFETTNHQITDIYECSNFKCAVPHLKEYFRIKIEEKDEDLPF